MALGWLISYAFVMSLFFIGSTHSCGTNAVQNCIIAAYGTADSTQISSLASKGPAVVCSAFNHFKDCADSANCSSEINFLIPSLYFGVDKTLCDDLRNKGSTHACDYSALQNCLVTAFGTANPSKFLASEVQAVVCSTYNIYKDCADSAYCSSEIPSYGVDNTSCDEWRNKGSTLLCEDTALQNCIVAAYGTADPTQILSVASKGPEVVCRKFNHFKDCADSAYCSSEINYLVSSFGADKTLCDEWRNKGSTHSCEDTALQNCIVAAYGTADPTQILSVASKGPEVVCSKFNHFKDCADSAYCSSEINYLISSFGANETLCDELRNKGGNGVSTLTPRLTVMMSIVFVVMTFTRLMK